MRKTLALLWAGNTLALLGIGALGVQIASAKRESNLPAGVTAPMSMPPLGMNKEALETDALRHLPNPLLPTKASSGPSGSSKLSGVILLLGVDEIEGVPGSATAYLMLIGRKVHVNAYCGEAILDITTGAEIPELAGWKLARVIKGGAVFRNGSSEETMKVDDSIGSGSGGPGQAGDAGGGASQRQWASVARASSEYSPQDWNAQQACGAPNTMQAGDIPTAWTTQNPDGGPEWIELSYGASVHATGVRIHETFNPGAVVKVEALKGGGEWHPLWQGSDPLAGQPMGWFEVPFNPLSFSTNTIRVTLDTARVPGFNEIDAVELIGTVEAPPDPSKKDPGKPGDPRRRKK